MYMYVCAGIPILLIASSYILALVNRAKKMRNKRTIGNMCISNLFCFPLLLLPLFSVSFLLWQTDEHEKSIINYKCVYVLVCVETFRYFALSLRFVKKQ